MLLKIIALFLVAIAVLAMFGRLRAGGRRPPPPRRPKPRLCQDCGRLLVTDDPCDCGGDGGGWGGRRAAEVPVRNTGRNGGPGPRKG